MTGDRSKNPPKSAAELMTELRKDLKYTVRMQQREEQQRVNAENYSRAAEPVLKELGARGFRVNTIGELRQSNAEYRAAVPILLHWLSRISDPQVKEDIVRTLSVPWAKPAAAPAVVRKNSVTHRKAQGSIRDAIRRGSDWHGLHRIPRGDGANWPFGSRTTRAADREHPDRVPCAGARRCNGGSTISEWIADAMRIAGSTNPDTRGESYQ